MATVSDIVTRALRKIGVVARDESATADDMAEGVATLNAMIHAWSLKGVDLAHTDYTSADTFDLGDEYIEGTIYLLAARLSPDYMIPPAFDADEWFRDFQGANMQIEAVDFESPLTTLPSRYGRRVQ